MSLRRPIVTAITAVLLAVLSCDFALPGSSVPGEAPSTAVAAVAFRLDEGRSELRGFIGPVTQTWDLEPGLYTIHAVDHSGLTITLSGMQIVDVPLIWPADFRTAGGVEHSARSSAIKALVSFLSAAELARLSALEHSSGGFTAPLYSVDPGQAELDAIYASYESILAHREASMAALDTLLQTSGAGGTGPRTAAPRPDWKETMFGFFGYAGGAGQRARDRILLIAEGMSPEDQADAFDVLRDRFKEDVQGFDDLAARLQSGELDDRAAQIESDMRNAPGFGAAAQQAGTTVGQTVHREGGELVVKGAEFQVEVVKHVLGQAFPEISEGFELADKANEWIEYVESVYKNPLLAAEGDLRDAAQESIKASILERLAACCGELDDDIAEAIADNLSEEAMAAVPSVVEGIQATQTAMAAQLGPDEAPQAAAGQIHLLGTFHEDLRLQDVSEVDFSAQIDLVADRASGTIAGSIRGGGTYNVAIECDSERGVAAYSLDYVAEVNASLDPGTGEFSTPYAPNGIVSFVQMVQPFGSEDCVETNSDLNITFPIIGAGTLQGVVYTDGAAEVITDWAFLEEGAMSGAWSGQGQVAP